MSDEQGLILKNTFHNSRYENIQRLVELKKKKGAVISLAFPTLNEEATIGKEILVIKTELMDRFPLLDEIVVIDSGSEDRTCEIAARYGAEVYQSRDILKNRGTYRGKGENLWKSLHVLRGNIIVWIDADIHNIAPKFLYGLVGPLLEDDEICYVKGFYERPIRTKTTLSSSGGGRVTEILVRPLFSLFYPELAYLIQPLSGEYAGRRRVLEQLPFSVGYGVETGHLIDIYHKFGVRALGQVDLDRRVHRNQSVQALSKMGYGILNTFFNRLNMYGEDVIRTKLHEFHIALTVAGEIHEPVLSQVPTLERPPIIELEEYRKKFHPDF